MPTSMLLERERVPDGATDSSSPVATGFLENGMQVVVIPDRRSPIVTHMVWYRNGSADDLSGKSGCAHFLEHMMFKGTERYPAGRFGALLAGLGGQQNAFTSHDVTTYYQRVAKEHLAACMTYEADRMRNLVVDEAVIESERKVILEERSMVCDSHPDRVLDEAVQAAAFPCHPSGRPVIGWRHEIEGLGRDDVLAYYRRFYTPENAILVVAGDAEPDAVLELATEIYGAIPRSGALPLRQRVQDPPVRTRRQLTLSDAKVRQPGLQRMYAVPSARTAAPGQAHALLVLSYLLGGDQTSVLHTRLVLEDKCALNVAVGYWPTAVDRSRFYINATPAPGTTPEALDRTIDRLLLELRATGFAPEAIARAKIQIIADDLYSRDSQVSLANWYGMALACGQTVEDLALSHERIRAVTTDDLSEALRILDPDTGVSGYLVASAPAPSDETLS